MNIGFEKLEVYYDGEATSKFGRIIIEPLERGFADTLGNALRRTMLSSMPGASVVATRIDNVVHEFDYIPGATLDMTEFILNLKGVNFKVEDEELYTVVFKKSEEGFYTAGDLTLPTGVEVLNPEAELINLTGEEEVEIEIFVKNGRGYIESEYHKELKELPGSIGVDGVFSPIEKVGYKKEAIRHNGIASYERLVLEVTTNGAVEPKDAVLLAAKILKTHLDFFENVSSFVEKTEIYQEKKEEEQRILDLPIEHLELSVRSYNCLKRDNYTSVRKIIGLTESQLAAIHQLGEKSVKEILAKVKELGLEMRKD